MTTLREIVSEYEANGFIFMSSGNGSAEPQWIDWDAEMDEAYGGVKMYPAHAADLVYAGQNENKDETIGAVAKYFIHDYSSDVMYASEWIEDDDRNAPYKAQNPYSYRIIF